MEQRSKVSHVGLDNHKNFSRVTARDADNRVAFRQRLEHDDRVALRGALADWPAGLPVILEGTFGWGWMADELTAAGHDPHLASSRKVAAWREARGLAKTNGIDADLLSELWPQQPRWWEVWLAPPAVRDERELLRYRMGLVRMQTVTKNRVHAILHRHGIIHGLSDLFGRTGLAFLCALAEGRPEATAPSGAEPLRPTPRMVLAGQLKLLRQLRQQIAAATRELRKRVKRHPQGELWRSLPGISWVLAYTIQAEVGDIGRFPGGDHLASYSLLTPLADDSGDEDDSPPVGRHVGHVGRRTLKWAFIEAAHGAAKKDATFRAIFDRRSDRGKRDRNRAYIAVARKLCVVGASCVRNGRRYTPAAPPRPGSVATREITATLPVKEKPGRATNTRQKRNGRPGLGQPDRAMVGVGDGI